MSFSLKKTAFSKERLFLVWGVLIFLTLKKDFEIIAHQSEKQLSYWICIYAYIYLHVYVLHICIYICILIYLYYIYIYSYAFTFLHYLHIVELEIWGFIIE